MMTRYVTMWAASPGLISKLRGTVAMIQACGHPVVRRGAALRLWTDHLKASFGKLYGPPLLPHNARRHRCVAPPRRLRL